MEIKPVWQVICLLALVSDSYAQMPSPPKEEFKLYSTVTTISIEQGQVDSVNISILRSRSFKNGNASLSLSSPAIKGLLVRINSLPDEPDNYMIYVSAGNEVEPGEYNILPTCTLKNKTKSLVMKVIVR